MSNELISLFERTLVAQGYHVTAARRAVFKLLLSGQPQSMRQILERAQGAVDRVSVYRNIDLFEKLGIVNRVTLGWKYKLELSDAFVPHHHHLTCTQCGTIIDIKDDAAVETFVRTVAGQFAFLPREHQFEISGLCQECQQTHAS